MAHMHEPARFAYWHARGKAPGAANALASRPSAFCVWSEKPEYLLFDDYDAYAAWVSRQPINARHYHEVIVDEAPQRLKFDIDVDVAALAKYTVPTDPINLPDALRTILGSKSGKFADLCMRIAETIADLFMLEYGREPEFIVCESYDHRRPVARYSRHLIIDGYYVSGSLQAREFTSRLLRVLPKQCVRYIDAGINKRLQNFRLPGCSKQASPTRIKQIISGHMPEDAIITNVAGLIPLDDIATPVSPIVRCTATACPDDIKSIVTAAGLDAHHRFRMRRDDVYVYNRIAPSYCEFCERTHDRDNTLIVRAVPSPEEGLIDVFMSCRKWSAENAPRSRRIGGYFAAIDQPGDGVDDTANERWTTERIERIIDRAQATDDKLFSAHKGVVYDEPVLRPFALCDTLVVHAAMKMGKTKALRNYINTYFPQDAISPQVIRFVSFRQTFGANIKAAFPDFVLYSDVRDQLLAQPRLIIQVESLHRLEIDSDPPDLLILDECESIFEQFSSGLIRNFAQASAKFIYMLKNARHVICMDANVSSRTENILRALRPDKPAQYHHNTHKNATDYTYKITGSISLWAHMLDSAITAGKRVAVPTSSLNTANAIADIVRRRHPATNLIVYSSETEQAVKSAHFSNVNVEWCKYDVVIYTPTLTAGVSFEAKHFDYVYGYFTDRSACDLSCIQMLGRIRDVAEREIVLCIVSTGAQLPVDADEIVQLYYDRRSALFVAGSAGSAGSGKPTTHAPDEPTGISIEYSPTGQLELVKSPYFHIWVENVRARNLSRNNFATRLISMITATGARVRTARADPDQNTAVVAMREEIIEASQRDLDSKHAAIAAAADIDDEEVAELRGALESGNGDVPTAAVNALRKHALRSHYGYGGPVTQDWVRVYGGKRMRDIYRNLCMIGTGDNLTIARIRSTEAATYAANMQLSEDFNYVDIHRRYTYLRHKLVRDLLEMCGFTDGIYDRRVIHRSCIVPDPGAANSLLAKVAREFEWSAPGRIVGRDAIASALINTCANTMRELYGFTMSTRKDMMICIVRPPKFVYPGGGTSVSDVPRVKPVFRETAVEEYDETDLT